MFQGMAGGGCSEIWHVGASVCPRLANDPVVGIQSPPSPTAVVVDNNIDATTVYWWIPACWMLTP